MDLPQIGKGFSHASGKTFDFSSNIVFTHFWD